MQNISFSNTECNNYTAYNVLKYICTKTCTIRWQINENKGKIASSFYFMIWLQKTDRLKELYFSITSFIVINFFCFKVLSVFNYFNHNHESICDMKSCQDLFYVWSQHLSFHFQHCFKCSEI